MIPDPSGAFINQASLEMHVLKTSPSESLHIASRCSTVLQKEQIKIENHPPFILVQNEANICIAILLSALELIFVCFYSTPLTHLIHVRDRSKTS